MTKRRPTEPTTAAQSPGAPRLGPRPLPLHVAIQVMTWMSSRAALPSLRSGLRLWSPELDARVGELAAALAEVEPEKFACAVDDLARRRMADFARGVGAYHRHPAARAVCEPNCLWSEGSTRLLDYGDQGDGGAPILVVPSLINRAYILDLAAGRSLLRFLAGAGFRPLLVDWGAPDDRERAFSLDDYIAGRLENALAVVRRLRGGPVDVVGYCMGGLLAVALAARRPKDVRSLVTLAAPWDFHAAGMAKTTLLRTAAPHLRDIVRVLGVLPVDLIQALFASLDPYATAEKFRRFARLDPTHERARQFVVLEDWLNDGVPLAGPAAIECLIGWYVENQPAMGTWRVAGEPVVAGDVRAPTLVVVPERDRIVPPASAQALAAAIPGAQHRVVAAGHIGMVAGSSAASVLYKPLVDWFSRTAA
ncbi:MAG: alpha/beta fold hydrolase [Rhodospirillales bacterium]|nr:alpha/beta fold hydrolase [Rhodospirillales bacterium]